MPETTTSGTDAAINEANNASPPTTTDIPAIADTVPA